MQNSLFEKAALLQVYTRHSFTKKNFLQCIKHLIFMFSETNFLSIVDVWLRKKKSPCVAGSLKSKNSRASIVYQNHFENVSFSKLFRIYRAFKTTVKYVKTPSIWNFPTWKWDFFCGFSYNLFWHSGFFETPDLILNRSSSSLFAKREKFWVNVYYAWNLPFETWHLVKVCNYSFLFLHHVTYKEMAGKVSYDHLFWIVRSTLRNF